MGLYGHGVNRDQVKSFDLALKKNTESEINRNFFYKNKKVKL